MPKNKKQLYLLGVFLILVGLGIGMFVYSEINSKAEADYDEYRFVPVVTGLNRPTFVTSPPDDARLFILEQQGTIRIVEGGDLLDEPFLDITDITSRDANERGLLGLAFHPDYEENGYFFIDHTNSEGDTNVARYEVSGEDPNRADASSREVVLEIEQPFGNHNGGMVAFGPDGYLYIGMGDGGSSGDPEENGQNPNTLLGTLLRINVDQVPYSIPPDNPFGDGQDGRPEVWAYGLRNPWRFSFDRETGDLYIADVGQNAYEEINFQPADSEGGQNYGWDVYEGRHRYEGEEIEGTTFPVVEYGRSDGCSVSGGYVYRGEELPELDGLYLYGDYCQGTIWWLEQGDDGWENGVFQYTDFDITSFGQDASGELYVVDRGGGVYRLEGPAE
jgi:glucose/arabinose dehydrogenase